MNRSIEMVHYNILELKKNSDMDKSYQKASKRNISYDFPFSLFCFE